MTKDLFECLDFSDNNILKITVFPPLRRVKSLIFANNAIQRIAPEAFNSTTVCSLDLSFNLQMSIYHIASY